MTFLSYLRARLLFFTVHMPASEQPRCLVHLQPCIQKLFKLSTDLMNPPFCLLCTMHVYTCMYACMRALFNVDQHPSCIQGYCGKVVIDAFDPGLLMSPYTCLPIDFSTADENDLQVTLPLFILHSKHASQCMYMCHDHPVIPAASLVFLRRSRAY
jgi:hypothetical protein